MLPWTMLIFDSEVADVGLRPGRWSIELAVQGLVWNLVTEVESCESESSGHDGEEDLRSGQSWEI
jgi:hypothetical protein